MQGVLRGTIEAPGFRLSAVVSSGRNEGEGRGGIRGLPKLLVEFSMLGFELCLCEFGLRLLFGWLFLFFLQGVSE